MSKHLDIHSTINDFVQEDVRWTALLEELGIDACCGGHKTLEQACAEKGLHPETVLNRLIAGSLESDPVAGGGPRHGRIALGSGGSPSQDASQVS